MAQEEEITFAVAGEALPAASRGTALGEVRQAARIVGTRAAGTPVLLKARPGQDVVRLSLANGPTLLLHPANARDLLAAQKRDTARGAAGDEGTVVVPMQLSWPGAQATATRDGLAGLGQATLDSIDVIGLVQDAAMQAAVDGATAWLARRLDGQVKAGVYALPPRGFTQSFLKAGQQPLAHIDAGDGQPLLVLVHGTFVETWSTFGKLWASHPGKVQQLFERYRGRVYALDHPTLGESPIRNALTLVAALPDGARVHLLTHSRGGLVAEVLARACSGDMPGTAQLAQDLPQEAADLALLFEQARAKRLRVERVVRVACPARGTLLASRRLDAYLSVLKWAMEMGGQVVLSTLVDFLHGIAQNRADFDKLPGLLAMMPESPFIEWLANQSSPIEGDLRVIAGDMQGDSLVSWIKTLVADAYYWTDNDLVVHTSAMYGGVARAARPGTAQFLLDRGGKVSHFTYFVNPRTAQAVVDGLLQDAPAGFQRIGPRSWAGDDASGVRAARAVERSRAASGAPASERPAVFVLPGILGSNIALDGRRIWLSTDFVNGLLQLAWDSATASHFTADGPLTDVYGALIERLADTHEVIPFGFDWRRPIEDEARRLAAEVDKALAARQGSGQPVRLLAHSMGAIVARTLQLQSPDVWQRMMQRHGARLVMLGPPNGGSWAPMQTLTGDDGFGNAVVALGSLLQNRKARALMAALPGFLQLQAGFDDPDRPLQLQATWEALARQDLEALTRYNRWHEPDAQQAVYGWSAPPQAVLDQAVRLRRALNAQLPALLADAAKILIVLGQDRFTPAGCELTDTGLEYVAAPEGGDGRVPHRSAQLPGVAMWKVRAPHGKLPQASQAFAGYVDLLTQGTTARLERAQPVAQDAGVQRGAGAGPAPAGLARSRPSRRFRDAAPPDTPADLMDTPAADGGAAGEALVVRVVNGDIQFVPNPLLVGHYRSLQLTGSELVLDTLLEGTMGRSLSAGLYPDATGTHQVFGNERPNPDNPLQMARPKAVVVVGLGEEGKLDANRLAFSVRQATLAYAQRLSELADEAPGSFELHATLIGSGGTRITTGTSAQSVVQGVLDANRKLAGSRWPPVVRLTLVELFLERATEAWHAVRQQAASGGRLRLEGEVEMADGAKRRPADASYRGAPYDFISVLSHRNEKGDECIAYELDTRRARTEVRAQHAQTALVRELVATASNQANRDPLIGRTLFNLLVPVEIEPYLAGTSAMVLEVDRSTAVIPWELLKSNPDATIADTRPWAVRSRVIRKLRTQAFRDRVSDATPDDLVLVIGEPAAPPEYPPLPGAIAEAEAVRDRLRAQLRPDQVRDLVTHEDAQTILNTLFDSAWRIVHIAGHGAPGPDGGVVLSGNTFLDATVVNAMRTVPELVFLNCCHLAGGDAKDFGSREDRARFAANVAEKLIEIGVRCVIAAGWAVEDGPAEVFATEFYAALLGGARFIDAVGAARAAAWKANPEGNTWAAYQCYGDPSWSWQRTQPSERAAGSDEQTPIASVYGLVLVLENLVKDVRFRAPGARSAPERIRALEAEHGARWGDHGSVAEAFGLAYAEVGATQEAIAWLQRALAAEDGGATLRAAEQLANLRARQAEKKGEAAPIRAAIAELERLVALAPTRERLSLLGSCYKRLSLVSWARKAKAEAARASEEAAARYAQARDKGTEAGALNAFYPARNAVACGMAAAMMRGQAPGATADDFDLVERLTRAAASAEPEFWSVVGVTELQLLRAVVAGRLQQALPGILAEFRDLQERVSAPWAWDSVATEARLLLGLYGALSAAAPGEQQAVQDLLQELQGYVSEAS